MRLTKTKLATAGSAIFAIGLLTGQAFGYQEHMHAALDALRNARHELDVAYENKGGHRDAAIRLVDEAIDEVQEGIDYAR